MSEHKDMNKCHVTLALVALGKSNLEIAKVEGISKNAVKQRLARYYDELGVYGVGRYKRPHAVYLAIRNGWVCEADIDKYRGKD